MALQKVQVVIALCGALTAAGFAARGRAATLEREAPAAAFEFSLRDQHGGERGFDFPMERAAVLLIADRKGSGQLDAWVRPLYDRYGDAIRIEGVAHLEGVPRLLRGVVTRIFRDRMKYPVMLDWSGEVSTKLESRPDVANVLIVEPDGGIPLRLSGAATEELLVRCYRALDGLLESTSPSEAP